METKGRKSIELLAPAGSKEAFIAAVEAGADAIYCGGKLFNARMNAGNFDDEEMKKAIDFAHKRGVRVHVTLNILIKDEELKEALEYAERLWRMGADALIVQDLGLARLIREHIPNLEMHLSTQGTIYDLEGVKAASKLGFKRVVLARELSLDEIKEICAESPVDIETFCHGAICMCYSGQCQLSRANGGRSGNRGACAQPCRLAYEGWFANGKEGKGYYLSPADMSFLDSMGDLIDAGVRSFKIEGRMKSPEYVAQVTGIYRKYIDLYLEKGEYEVSSEDREALAQIFSRGFTDHHLKGEEDSDFMSGDISKNKGVLVGNITKGKVGRNLAEIKTLNHIDGGQLIKGDLLEIRGKGDSERVSLLLTYLEPAGKNVYRIGDVKEPVKEGHKVYRISSKAQGDREGIFYKNKDWNKGKFIRKVPVMVNIKNQGKELLTEGTALTKDGREFKAQVVAGPFPEASGNALVNRIESAFAKTGDTPLKFAGLNIEGTLDFTATMAELNGVRRKLYSALEEKMVEVAWAEKSLGGDMLPEDLADTREDGGSGIVELFFYNANDYLIHGKALVKDIMDKVGKDQISFRILLPAFQPKEIERIVQGEEGLEFVPYIDTITRGRRKEIEEALGELAEIGIKKIYIGNIGWIDAVKKMGMIPLADFGLNIYNRAGEVAMKELGLDGGMPSLETEGRYYGRIPLMVMEHSPEHASLKTKGRKYQLIKDDYRIQTILAPDGKVDYAKAVEEAVELSGDENIRGKILRFFI